MSGSNVLSVLDVLRAGRELISNPVNWTQVEYARGYDTSPVDSCSPLATCWCSLGALQKTALQSCSFTMRTAVNRLNAAVTRDTPPLWTRSLFSLTMEEFNDTHTHEQVIAVWDDAIKREMDTTNAT
jgi:hypothetical protein